MKETVFVAYDTVCSIRIEETENKESGLILKEAKKLAKQVQNTLNMYDPISELSRLCLSYIPGKKITVSKMLWEFIKVNLEFSYRTEGVFDFTVGPLMKLWDFTAEHPKPPPEYKLERALDRVGFQKVHTDSAAPEVTFDVPGMVLDPGASGKGYALRLAADWLKERGVNRAVLDFGGNLFAIGGKQGLGGEERPWKAAIRSPQRDAVLGTVELCNRGIATSSWYEHGFEKNGTVYHHLLDVKTGKPRNTDISSVSVLSSNALYTDLMSTAFFVMGVKKGCALAEEIEEETGVDLDYVVLKTDGELIASKNACFRES